MTPDVNVVVINFPNAQREMVVQNEDGSYTILINSKLSHDGQLKAYNHAMEHINDNDFEKEDVQSIEAAAHKISVPTDAEIMPAQKYLDRIKRLQKERRRLNAQIEKDKERVRFIMDNCDMFKRAEYHHLYGDDL